MVMGAETRADVFWREHDASSLVQIPMSHCSQGCSIGANPQGNGTFEETAIAIHHVFGQLSRCECVSMALSYPISPPGCLIGSAPNDTPSRLAKSPGTASQRACLQAFSRIASGSAKPLCLSFNVVDCCLPSLWRTLSPTLFAGYAPCSSSRLPCFVTTARRRKGTKHVLSDDKGDGK